MKIAGSHVLAFGIGIIAAGLLSLPFASARTPSPSAPTPQKTVMTKTRTVVTTRYALAIAPGESAAQVAKELQGIGAVSSAAAFLKTLGDRSVKLQPGIYRLTSHMPLKTIAAKLTH